MKTMKYILLVISVACASTMMAVEYKLHQKSSVVFKSTSSTQFYSGSVCTIASTSSTTAPTVEFRSTSAMPSLGTTLSLSTLDAVSVEEPETNITSGPKQSRPEDWEDPYQDPIGDAVLPLLLLAAGYSIYLRRKNSVRTPDAGHNQ